MIIPGRLPFEFRCVQCVAAPLADRASRGGHREAVGIHPRRPDA
jgi:hypothetical protein